MLGELNKVLEVRNGLGYIKHEPLASPTFVLLHFISEFLKDNRQVIFVSLHTSMDLLRINAGKLAIRIEPSFQFVTFKEFLSNALEDGPASLMSLFQRIQEGHILNKNQHKTNDETEAILYHSLIRNNPSSSKSLLIFDDLSAFSSLGYSSAQTLRCLQKLRKMLPCESLVVFASHNDDFARFTNTFDFCIEISLIGTGLGKGVTGKLEIAQRKFPFESLPLISVYHYLLGERSVNMFLMGSAQAAFI